MLMFPTHENKKRADTRTRTDPLTGADQESGVFLRPETTGVIFFGQLIGAEF